jgi:hypothetical protein
MMALTTAQLQQLKTAILNDAVLNAYPNNSDGAWAIAQAMNATASPAFVVWKTSVSTRECKQAMIWTEFVGRSTGERDAWQFMLSNGTINAADTNVRQGIADIFSGTQGATSRNNLLAISKRDATLAEKLFASGTGSTASPATMSFEGNLSYQDVLLARNLA